MDTWNTPPGEVPQGKLSNYVDPLPNLDKSTENLSKIADKDKWLREVRGDDPLPEDIEIQANDDKYKKFIEEVIFKDGFYNEGSLAKWKQFNK